MQYFMSFQVEGTCLPIFIVARLISQPNPNEKEYLRLRYVNSNKH